MCFEIIHITKKKGRWQSAFLFYFFTYLYFWSQCLCRKTGLIQYFQLKDLDLYKWIVYFFWPAFVLRHIIPFHLSLRSVFGKANQICTDLFFFSEWLIWSWRTTNSLVNVTERLLNLTPIIKITRIIWKWWNKNCGNKP